MKNSADHFGGIADKKGYIQQEVKLVSDTKSNRVEKSKILSRKSEKFNSVPDIQHYRKW